LTATGGGKHKDLSKICRRSLKEPAATYSASAFTTDADQSPSPDRKLGEQVKVIATLISATVAALVLGAGTAKADCQTQCYDSGNTGYHCVTTCN
jgi:hypothetical protein